MKQKKLYTMTAIFAATTMSSLAATINVNYHVSGSDSMNGTAYVDNTTSMIAYTGTTWTDITGGNAATGPLNDSDGIATTVTATTTGFVNVASNGQAGATGVPTLAQDYAYVRDNAGTLTIGGLDATSTYDLYLSGQGDNFDQNAIFTLDSVVKSPDLLTAWPSDFGTEGQLWVSYLSITGVTSLDITVDHNTARWAGLNGFQLEVTPVPEPSSTALLGLGAIAFITRRKR